MISFLKNNIVMVIAAIAAIITSFIVPPDIKYLSYIDFKTITCLFCVLAVVCAFKNINFFFILAQRIIKSFKNLRFAIIALVYITFMGSMLIANDMALLTFLPLGYFVLKSTNKTKYMAFTFIMQNIAANLGGMLTPFGNPQNLYLYTKFNIPNVEFIKIMLPPFVISIFLITICCLFIKKEPLIITDQKAEFSIPKTIIYSILFIISIAIVFRSIPYYVGLIIIPTVLLFIDKKALRAVDYPLLLTFVFFFIFAGNMARIDIIRELFAYLLDMNTLIFSTLSCQVISNVPSSVLLSQFTNNYQDLLVGVNIGGVGTLISSLASLITFSEYRKYNPEKAKYYLILFSAFNFGFLLILMTIMSFI